MQKSPRGLAAAATLTLTVGLTLGSAPAMAAPHGHQASAHGHHATAAAHGHSGAHGKSAAHKLVHLQKKVVGAATRASRQIGLAVTDQQLLGLDVDSATTLKSNAAADQAALKELADAAAAATSTDELLPLAATVKTFRQENYRIAVGLLHSAARLSAKVAAATTADPTLDMTAAQAALADAVAKAQAVVATDPRTVFKPIRADLQAVGVALDAAAAPDPTGPTGPTGPTDPTP